MKEFRSIFKQDFADYIETNQGTIGSVKEFSQKGLQGLA